MPPSREDSFRAALLVIGAPTPRYHRQRGPNARLYRMTVMYDRIRFIEIAAGFVEQYFGEVALHGSFLNSWMDGYEEWYTQCVSKQETDNGK